MMMIGYMPKHTATISTTVYQLYKAENYLNELQSLNWVVLNLIISAAVLLSVNMLETRQKKAVKA